MKRHSDALPHGSAEWAAAYRAERLAEDEANRERRGRSCAKTLACGGRCRLAPGHAPPCLCDGDEDGVPGSCPA
jgi:hypothetical protein